MWSTSVDRLLSVMNLSTTNFMCLCVVSQLVAFFCRILLYDRRS